MYRESALSPRESQIASLVATGASNKEIAHKLAISTKTVKNLLTNVFRKTSTRSRTELAIKLLRSEYEQKPISPAWSNPTNTWLENTNSE